MVPASLRVEDDILQALLLESGGYLLGDCGVSLGGVGDLVGRRWETVVVIDEGRGWVAGDAGGGRRPVCGDEGDGFGALAGGREGEDIRDAVLE